MIYKFFDKKSAAHADIAKESRTKNNFKPTPQLADELHKSIIRKFERHKLYSSFIDNIWGTDLDDMKLSWYNKGTCFFICAIDVWSKYECVVPFKDKSDETINKAFQKMIKYSNCRPKKIQVNKCSDIYTIFLKSWLENNNFEVYSTRDEKKKKQQLRSLRNQNIHQSIKE